MQREIINPFKEISYGEEELLNLEKALKGIGVNLKKNELEYRNIDLELLQEIADKWDELSKPENRILKFWICRWFVGIRKNNLFISFMDKLHK